MFYTFDATNPGSFLNAYRFTNVDFDVTTKNTRVSQVMMDSTSDLLMVACYAHQSTLEYGLIIYNVNRSLGNILEVV